MAALQDDVARNGPWEFRMAPFRVRNMIVLGVISYWAMLSKPEKREYATQMVIMESRQRCSFVWSLVIGLAVRAFITWLLKKYETDPAYARVVRHVRKIRGGRFA